MRTALRKMGNSTGVIVPRAILSQLGVGLGTAYEVSVDGDRIVFAPADSGSDVQASSARGKDQMRSPDEDERELQALAEELNASAARMAERLDKAAEAVRHALDPEREAEIRRRCEAEFAGRGDSLLAGLA